MASIELSVKTMDGKSNVISVEKDNTIRKVKEAIASKTGIEADRQRVLYNGKILDDAKTLVDYKIEDRSTIFMVARPAAPGTAPAAQAPAPVAPTVVSSPAATATAPATAPAVTASVSVKADAPAPSPAAAPPAAAPATSAPTTPAAAPTAAAPAATTTAPKKDETAAAKKAEPSKEEKDKAALESSMTRIRAAKNLDDFVKALEAEIRTLRPRPPPPASWDCKVCTYKNEPFRTRCEMCEADKAGNARAPGDDFGGDAGDEAGGGGAEIDPALLAALGGMGRGGGGRGRGGVEAALRLALLQAAMRGRGMGGRGGGGDMDALAALFGGLGRGRGAPLAAGFGDAGGDDGGDAPAVAARPVAAAGRGGGGDEDQALQDAIRAALEAGGGGGGGSAAAAPRSAEFLRNYITDEGVIDRIVGGEEPNAALLRDAGFAGNEAELDRLILAIRTNNRAAME